VAIGTVAVIIAAAKAIAEWRRQTSK